MPSFGKLELAGGEVEIPPTHFLVFFQLFLDTAPPVRTCPPWALSSCLGPGIEGSAEGVSAAGT